jgi:hypothetical protein
VGFPRRKEQQQEHDTVRDVETSSDVRSLLDAIAAGEHVERNVLVEELDRMLRLVVRTDADFDFLVLMVKRKTSLALAEDGDIMDVHVLPDGTTIIHTTWSMSTKRIVAQSFDHDNAPLVTEHDDDRGVPCFRASQVDIAKSARSYDDALHLLGKGSVTFLLPPSLTQTCGD